MPKAFLNGIYENYGGKVVETCCFLGMPHINKPVRLRNVSSSFQKLNVELVDLSEAHCCGDPIKSVKDSAANYLASYALCKLVESESELREHNNEDV